MEIKDFVKTSIIGIIQGVDDAIKEVATLGIARTKINPPGWGELSNAEKVSFDIAVTVQEGSNLKGSGGVTVATVFKAGTSAESNSANSAVSRLTFTVPVCLPASDKGERPEGVVNRSNPAGGSWAGQ